MFRVSAPDRSYTFHSVFRVHFCVSEGEDKTGIVVAHKSTLGCLHWTLFILSIKEGVLQVIVYEYLYIIEDARFFFYYSLSGNEAGRVLMSIR